MKRVIAKAEKLNRLPKKFVFRNQRLKADEILILIIV